MKLATFKRDGHTSLGVVDTARSQILDLAKASAVASNEAANPAFASMLALIDAGGSGLDQARALAAEWPAAAAVPIDSVGLMSPIPEPRQMRDCLTFELHLRNAIAQSAKQTGVTRPFPEVWFKQPIYYKANRFATIGTGQNVEWPAYAGILDYELEFGCWIGTPAKDVTAAEARRHIFGYSIFNDISARDAQMHEMSASMGPAKGKDFDTGNVIGPCIVTADEIDPYDLTMVARVNGEEWSRNTTSTMHWRFEDMIAHISRSETLHPGEFLGSGTIGGGCGLELGRFLSPGDLVELEVSGIGTLRNRITRP